MRPQGGLCAALKLPLTAGASDDERPVHVHLDGRAVLVQA